MWFFSDVHYQEPDVCLAQQKGYIETEAHHF